MEYLKIDKEKLKVELKRVGTTFSATSLQLGRSENYLASTFNQFNGLPKIMCEKIEKLYGIKFDDIKADMEPDPIDTTEVQAQKTNNLETLENLKRQYKFIDLVVITDVQGEKHVYRAPKLSHINPGDVVEVETDTGAEIVDVDDVLLIDTKSDEYKFFMRLIGADEPLKKVLNKVIYEKLNYEME